MNAAMLARLEDLGADTDDALERLGDEAFTRMVRDFVGNDLPERIRAALLAGNAAEAGSLAHTLKGVALGLGLLPVSDAAMDIQMACREHGVQAGMPLLEPLEAAVRAVRESIE